MEEQSSPEHHRLAQDRRREKNWKRWGPYLAERQWGTVREDYSANGDAWGYFPHDHARSRAYRWGEDGILGITDRECRLCFALSLWNGQDPILKERLFGLAGPQGNHGEDVKELYYYLDATPTSSYLRGLYKYPQKPFPYEQLLSTNRARSLFDPEFEVVDAGVFEGEQYFDVYAEYAKASPDDVLIRINAFNRGGERALLYLLPTLWFRNSWVWGCRHEGCEMKPSLRAEQDGLLRLQHETLGEFKFAYERLPELVEILFTENETNYAHLFRVPNVARFVKDAFHRYLIGGEKDAVNRGNFGTKAAPLYRTFLAPGERFTVRMRLMPFAEAMPDPFTSEFDKTFAARIQEADQYYRYVLPAEFSVADRSLARQAGAGLLWSRQFYHYVVKDWLDGDPNMPAPPHPRKEQRNHEWLHVFNRDVLSVPDKWEYPWFAAWDLAFQMIPFARLDPDFAKQQLILLLREWYMHPNGQLPAYEFDFSDVNPPVHAWAAFRVYKMTGARGARDRNFLESVFQKLLLNFTWWVNRKDFEGNNIFSGGFLGMDNVGLFDRSRPLPGGALLQQADGTAWMAFYCLTMLAIALELAETNAVYEDLASKFFEHYVAIADAINFVGGSGLWDETDGFYYDQLKREGQTVRLKARSLVGLVPLLAVYVLDEQRARRLPQFYKRMQWFLRYRDDLSQEVSFCEVSKQQVKRLLAIPSRAKLLRALEYVFDEREFLSPFGIRSLSRYHERHPVRMEVGGEEKIVTYTPGLGTTLAFGGNSNWRGPIWFPMNYLLIEALEQYYYFYGDTLQVEYPKGSGRTANLREAAQDIARRVTALYVRGEDGHTPWCGRERMYDDHPHWRELSLFYEYFHAETGEGLGASHQTGWTALLVPLMGIVRQKAW